MTGPFPIVFTRRASSSILETADWWRENRLDAPEAVAEELTRALDILRYQPEAGAVAENVRLRGVRRILLARIHYHLYYRPRTRPRRIEILEIWHAQRGSDPDFRD